MSKFSFFSDLVNTLFDKKNRKKNFSFLFEKKQNKSLLEYIENVNDAKGEISALSYSEELFCLHLLYLRLLLRDFWFIRFIK